MKIALIIFAVLLILCLLILFSSVFVKLDYESESEDPFHYSIRFLFLVFSDRKKKKKGKKDKEKSDKKGGGKKKEDENKENKKKKKKSVGEIFEIVKSLASALLKFCKHITIKNVEINLKEGTGDAAETAIAYGRNNALVHGALSLIKNGFTVKKEKICISPDFTEEKTKFGIRAEVKVRGLHVIVFGIRAFNVILKAYDL